MSDKTNKVTLAVMANDIAQIKKDIEEIKTKLEHDYVTQIEFMPIKKLVYGMVVIMLVAVVGALIKLVILP